MQFEKRIRKEMLLSLHQGEFRHQTSFLVWYKRKKADLSKGRPAYNCTTSGFAKFKSAFLLTFLERKTRLELATLTLARLCSTN